LLWEEQQFLLNVPLLYRKAIKAIAKAIERIYYILSAPKVLKITNIAQQLATSGGGSIS